MSNSPKSDSNVMKILLNLCLRLKIIILETGAVDSGSSSSSSSSSFVNGATSKNLPAVQTVAPMPEDSAENMRYTLLFVLVFLLSLLPPALSSIVKQYTVNAKIMLRILENG